MPGDRSQPQTIELSNSAANGAPIPLQIHVSPQVDYIRWSLSSDSTPATLSVFIDAAELLPDITYAAELIIESVGVSVTNTPYRIPILIRVDKGMIIRPAGISVVLSPCGASPALPQLDLRVLGTAGITFGAVVDAGPAREQNAPQDIASLPQIESAAIGKYVTSPGSAAPSLQLPLFHQRSLCRLTPLALRHSTKRT